MICRVRTNEHSWSILLLTLFNKNPNVSTGKLSLCPLGRALSWKDLWLLILSPEMVTITFPVSQRHPKCGIASEVRMWLRWAHFLLLFTECVWCEMYVDCCWKNLRCMNSPVRLRIQNALYGHTYILRTNYRKFLHFDKRHLIFGS